jgi:hypothetical protein
MHVYILHDMIGAKNVYKQEIKGETAKLDFYENNGF